MPKRSYLIRRLLLEILLRQIRAKIELDLPSRSTHMILCFLISSNEAETSSIFVIYWYFTPSLAEGVGSCGFKLVRNLEILRQA